MPPIALDSADACYPAKCRERMGGDAPARLSALGNLDLLALPKTAIFCSARCPGHVILTAYDQAERLTQRLTKWSVPFSTLRKA